MAPTPLTQYPQLALLVLALVAAGWDLRTRTIPNWLTLSGAVAGLLLDPGIALKGIGFAFLIQLPFFLLGWIGGGDVKLLAAAGAIGGWSNLLWLFLVGSVVQGLITLAVIAVQKLRKQPDPIGVPRGPSFAVAVALFLLAI